MINVVSPFFVMSNFCACAVSPRISTCLFLYHPTFRCAVSNITVLTGGYKDGRIEAGEYS